jgi:lambda family phage portal protein
MTATETQAQPERVRLSELQGRSALVVRRPRELAAGYDAAETTTDNSRHWANADGLSAAAAASPARRQTLRRRARYEVANNSYARGIVNSLANDLIGTGPRLQMRLADPEANRRIEADFADWARAIDLPAKLRTLRAAKAQDGEAFAILTVNPAVNHPVQLDVALVEADRVASPFGTEIDPTVEADGIVFDKHNNPRKYYVQKSHPGDVYAMSMDFDTLAPRDVIHWFRADRPGQVRGLPDVMPALPLFAQLRRYTLAVIAAAEAAADQALVIQSNEPPNDDDETGSPRPVAMDVFELEARMATVLPDGFTLGQVKAEQPTTTYGDFKREILCEIGRCLLMPYNVVAGISADYNYASGRLDFQTYDRMLDVEQDHLARVVLDRILARWFYEYVLTTAVPPAVRHLSIDSMIFTGWHEWYFDGRPHVDPVKTAAANKLNLDTGLETLASLHGRAGKDWETNDEQIAREIGVSVPELRRLRREKRFPTKPAAPTPAPAPKQKGPADADPTQKA